MSDGSDGRLGRGDTPRQVVAGAIREVIAASQQPAEVGELIASWYAEVLEGNVQLEPETAAVRERAFQELERIFDRMWTPPELIED